MRSSLCIRLPKRTLERMSAGSSASKKARTSARKDSSSALSLRFTRVFSFDHDDDLAARITRTEPRDSVHSPLQREALGDRRLDAALEIERHEGRDIGGMLPGLAHGELSPEHTDDLAT